MGVESPGENPRVPGREGSALHDSCFCPMCWPQRNLGLKPRLHYVLHVFPDRKRFTHSVMHIMVQRMGVHLLPEEGAGMLFSSQIYLMSHGASSNQSGSRGLTCQTFTLPVSSKFRPGFPR